MQLHPKSASYFLKVKDGCYTVSRLIMRALRNQASQASQVNQNLKAKGRRKEDLEEKVSEEIGGRDYTADELNTIIQEIRQVLISRSLTANKNYPFTAIFDRGLEYYTRGPVAEHANRANELKQRCLAHLPADDPVLIEKLPLLDQRISAYQTSLRQMMQAEADVSLARTALDIADDEWRRCFEQVYGELVALFGKREAEKFFAKRKGKSSKAAAAAAGQKKAMQ